MKLYDKYTKNYSFYMKIEQNSVAEMVLNSYDRKQQNKYSAKQVKICDAKL